MPKELYINDLIDKLPRKIDAIIFSPELELFIENIASIAKLNNDDQIWLHSIVTDLLIGKIDIPSFQKILFDISLSEQTSQLIFNYLDQKVFSNIKDELLAVQKIYEKESASKPVIEKNHSESINTSGTSVAIVNYIQELAASIKKNEEPVIANSGPTVSETEKVVITNTKSEETKVEPVIIKNEVVIKEPADEVAPEAKPVEEVPTFVTKESPVFKMMRYKEEQSNGKLNEYFKALKDSLDFGNTSESENIFQPPFKATKGRSMMVESNIEESNDNTTVNESKEPKKEPVRYNSFEFMKKPNVPSEAKSADDKFIDLGDF